MTEEMLRSMKEQIDENRGGLPTIIGTKCKRCGKIHPIVSYYWHLDTRREPSVTINIQCPDNKHLDLVYEAERALSQLGIHFDTGYGGGRDWEFDWSLSGYHYILDKKTGKYVPLEHRNKDTIPTNEHVKSGFVKGYIAKRRGYDLTKLRDIFENPPLLYRLERWWNKRKLKDELKEKRELSEFTTNSEDDVE